METAFWHQVYNNIFLKNEDGLQLEDQNGILITSHSYSLSGGSISNMYALMIARHKLYPEHKKHGMRAIKGQLIMYTSRHVSLYRNIKNV